MAFDITDIAGLRRSPTQAGAAARMAPQNVFPYRPGASPVPETPSTAPAAPRKTRNQIAWEAVQLNPNRGTLPPELSTGSRMLDDELFRAARRMSGMANSRAAVEELKRKQWLTGERTLADEMPGATAPDYAGAWAPEKQVGPPDNGVWTAPDGTRYAMRDGVPVGRSGTAAGQWSMEQGNVGEFTGGSDRATRRNILRDEILGKMAETVGPPAPSRNVIPAVPAAQTPPTPAAAQTPPTPAAAQTPPVSKERQELGRYKVQEALQRQDVSAALREADKHGLLSMQQKQDFDTLERQIRQNASSQKGAYRTALDRYADRVKRVKDDLDKTPNNRGSALRRAELLKELRTLEEEYAVTQKLYNDMDAQAEWQIAAAKQKLIDSIISP